MVKAHIADWEITLDGMKEALKRANMDLERISKRLEAVNAALEKIPVSTKVRPTPRYEGRKEGLAK